MKQASLVYCVFSRCLVTVSNGGRSPSSRFPNCPRPQLPASNSNSSQQLNPTHQPTRSTSLHWTEPTPLSAYTIRHGPRREHQFPVSSLVRVRNLLPSNGRCLQSHYLATGLHATILKESALCLHRVFLGFLWLKRRMIRWGWIMNCRGCGRKWSWPDSRYYQGMGLWTNKKAQCLDSWCSQRDSNRARPENLPMKRTCSAAL
jgi:hypothetical protein